MQVKKFEAPTLQEALDNIKRELGPEAIILQTKKYKRGFGLMSRASVEVTAAVSDRSLHKKKFTEERLPEPTRESVKKLPAEKQAQIFDKNLDKHLEKSLARTQDQVSIRGRAAAPASAAASAGTAAELPRAEGPVSSKPITARRYIDIDDGEGALARAESAGRAVSVRQSQAAALSAAAIAKSGMTVEDELKHLKRMVEEIRNAQEGPTLGSGAQALMGNDNAASALSMPTLQDAYEQLVLSGVDKRYALALLKKVGFELGDRSGDPDEVLDQLACEIMESTQVTSLLADIPVRESGDAREPAVIAIVGPTGVGKTTTVAKIASEALLRRSLKVGVINLDGYKVGAFDQLATYAKILNIPFRSASSAEDLGLAMRDFAPLDLVIVDTTGRSHRDSESLKEMQELLERIPQARTHLVLAATTRDSELYDMSNRFSVARPDGLIFSKLDEATTYGAIYNVSQKMKLPIAYFTTGQRVPEDIEEASRERTAALIMDL